MPSSMKECRRHGRTVAIPGNQPSTKLSKKEAHLPAHHFTLEAAAAPAWLGGWRPQRPARTRDQGEGMDPQQLADLANRGGKVRPPPRGPPPRPAPREGGAASPRGGSGGWAKAEEEDGTGRGSLEVPGTAVRGRGGHRPPPPACTSPPSRGPSPSRRGPPRPPRSTPRSRASARSPSSLRPGRAGAQGGWPSAPSPPALPPSLPPAAPAPAPPAAPAPAPGQPAGRAREGSRRRGHGADGRGTHTSPRRRHLRSWS